MGDTILGGTRFWGGTILGKHNLTPANTKKNTTLAYKVFSDWLTKRNNNAEEQCPEDLLENRNAFKSNYWLTQFVAEVRRQDGKLFRIAIFRCCFANR